MVMMLALVGCDSGSSGTNPPAPPPATGNSTTAPASANKGQALASQPTTRAGSILAPESQDEPSTRPAAILVVQGGEAEIAYRGWPIRIMYRRLDGVGSAPAALSVRGPSDVIPVAAPNTMAVWLIPPEKSAALASGTYVFSAGAASTDVVVQDEPVELSADQNDAKRLALASHALAMADTAGAEHIVREWVAASPKNPAAHAALGDVLAAAGKPDDALAAYNEAIRHVPPGVTPPGDPHRKAAMILRQSIATMPTRPASAPTANDLAYYKILDEGDALLNAGNYPRALRAYERAKTHYSNYKLTFGSGEADQKIAYTREQLKRPATRPTTSPH